MRKKLLALLLLSNYVLAAQKNSSNELPLPKNIPHELILSYPTKTDKSFSVEEALRICAQYKELNRRKYFYVFCKIGHKEIEEKVLGYTRGEKWIFKGLSREEEGDYWGYYRITETPIYQKVPTKKWETQDILQIEVHTLSIWGVAKLSESPWKLIESSLHYKDSEFPLSFLLKKDALLYCREILAEEKSTAPDSLIYDRAKCFISENPNDGKYYFEIKSQNPFL